MMLPRLTVLNEQYAVRSVVGKVGPLDVTYLAWDLANEEQVIVREFLPVDHVTRDSDGLSISPVSEEGKRLFGFGLDKFKRESQVLSNLEHPNIIRLRDHFQQHGTA